MTALRTKRKVNQCNKKKYRPKLDLGTKSYVLVEAKEQEGQKMLEEQSVL